MNFEVMTIGKIRPGFHYDGEQEYLKRLTHYTNISCSVIKSVKLSSSANGEVVKKRETEEIFRKIRDTDFMVALDKSGKQFTSEQLADEVNRWQYLNRKRIVFVIGGAVGLSRELINRADLVLSFSKMTFQHDMAKLILLEQLYRAFTILNGEKYHK